MYDSDFQLAIKYLNICRDILDDEKELSASENRLKNELIDICDDINKNHNS